MDKLLKHLNRYWPRTLERVIEIVADGFVGEFKEAYFVGQYILIKNSIMSDGVYKLIGATPTKLTVAEVLTPESTQLISMYGLAIPRDVIALNDKIEAYKGTEGIASESIDDYSISYKNGSGWQVAFKDELNAYRLMFSDMDGFDQRYRWQDRWC